MLPMLNCLPSCFNAHVRSWAQLGPNDSSANKCSSGVLVKKHKNVIECVIECLSFPSCFLQLSSGSLPLGSLVAAWCRSPKGLELQRTKGNGSSGLEASASPHNAFSWKRFLTRQRVEFIPLRAFAYAHSPRVAGRSNWQTMCCIRRVKCV